MSQRKQRRRGFLPGNEAEQEKKEQPAFKTKKITKKSKKKPKIRQKNRKTLGKTLFGLVFLLLYKIIRLPFFLLRRIPIKRGMFGSLLKVGIIAGVCGFVGLIILFVVVSRDLPDPDKLTDRQVAQSTKIYDKTGEHLLYEIFAEQKRTLIALEDIPQNIINGVIATEDADFYEHKGVRPLSIVRSVIYGVMGKSRLGGGASTLTQQLVKNAILTNERTITRKAKEIILSIRLEQKYTKDQILKIYFNEIPYGSTNYGIQSAAQNYFGKDAQDLTLAEAATLAGFPKAPTRYLNDSNALKQRRNFVLRRMFEEGFITKEEKERAQDEELTLQRTYENMTAPHFVLYVKEQLVQQYGEHAVDTGGLKVITSLDWDMQRYAEEAVKKAAEAVFEKANANNAALVAMDPNNGHILAMIGSKEYGNDEIHGQFNVATLGKRQPGSSFKPIVYAAAFEKGYTPQTILFDVETNFAASGKDYKPLNYDLQEHGAVTMRQSLQGSLNIPAVKALYLVGSQKGVDFATRLGYSTFGEGDFGLSLVLGGGEVHLLEHVGSYGVFANGGKKYEPVSILRVENSQGNVLEEWKKKNGKRVLDKDVAATITHVLQDDEARSYAFGAGGVLTLPGRPVAAKTGTTNRYVDAWTVGYTPNLVAGVWAGNTDNSPMTRGFGGSKVAGPIWQGFMKNALQGKPVESFPELPKSTTKKPALTGSHGGSVALPINKITGNIATSSTPENLIVQRTFTQQHSILHYVQKDDPQGPAPIEPEKDSQYTIWEDAILDWITRKQEEDPEWDVSFEEPPTTEDDEYAIGLIPKLEVIFPTPSSTLTSRQFDTDIRVSAPRGVSKVTYRLDQRYVGVIREHPFNLNKHAPWLSEGNHTLTIIVEDDIGNRLEEVIPFILNTTGLPLEEVVIEDSEEAPAQTEDEITKEVQTQEE